MAKNRFTLVVFLLFVGLTYSYAQLSVGGSPISFLFPSLAEREVPTVVMQPVDVASLKAEDAENALNMEKRQRFGYEMDVRINPENAGVTDVLPGGDKLWRVAVSSPGALTINLIFSQYRLPAGAQLFIYNADKTEIIGAFTEANNQFDDRLGTTLVNGDKMVIEYYEPARAAFAGKVEIGTVVHGYRTPGDTGKDDGGADDRGFGASGSCNINVACPLGDGWGAQKRSVVKIVNGGDWCSGAMINNTNNNGTPYMLTANHCYTSNYSTWVYWFNYQSATCTNPGSNPSYNSLSGATLKARRSNSDFCLLQLTSTPPATYDVFYSGWSRSTSAPTQETGIHHPSGDIKKISRDNNAATNGGSGGWGADHWRVYWDQGVTEGGSSGSPLYDQNKRIVGQLHGGASYCGAPPSALWDEYGKLSDSWNGTSASKRLKDWLDPSNSGATTLDGYSPNGNYSLVANSNGNVGHEPATYVYDVASNVAWTATSHSPWIQVRYTDRASGQVQIAFERNDALETRVGVVEIGGQGTRQLVTLTQFGIGSKNLTLVEEGIGLSPNPSSGMVNVQLPGIGLAEIAVFDVTGRLVLETQAQHQTQLDLGREVKGLYFVRIRQAGEVTTLRLVKE